MERILVVGASRGIGLEVVKQAVSMGYAVRALARTADKINLSHPNLEKYPGSAVVAKDISAALEGVAAVVLTLGVPATLAMVLKPVRLFSDATRIIVQAMQAAKVRRLIAVTGFGAGDSRASITPLQGVAFRLVFGRAYDDKDIQENLIRESDLKWVIARPGILTNGPRSARYKVLDDPRLMRNGRISRADVADFLIRQIKDDSYLGKTPVLIS